MARIRLPEPDEIDGPHADAVQESLDRWGFLANIEKALASWPALATAEQDLTQAVLVEGQLDAGLKEAAGVVVSRVNECDYCATHHTFQMELAGRDEAEQAAINALEFGELDERDQAALRFAEKAARDPNKVTDADVDALREAGFDDRGILELVTVISMFMFYNTFTTTLGLKLDEEVQAYAHE